MGACCGAGRTRSDYEVTFKDGSTETFETLMAARLAVANDVSVGRPAATMKAVPRKM